MLANQRHHFDLPDDVAYLNCAYMGPLPLAARGAGETALFRKGRPWEIIAADFFQPADEARGLFAQLVGATPEDIAIVPSASYGLAIAAANLPLRAGQRILLLAEQFPSNVYVWHAKAAAAGADVLTVARPEDDDWTSAILAALDERVAIVALPHCHWTDGSLVDLERVSEKTRKLGAALVIDATQSVGALPIDVAALDPDFMVVAGYKWMLGPYGLGYLYAAPRHQQGVPIEENWVVRQGAEDFARLVDYRDEYAPGARRFDQGGRGQLQLLPSSVASMRLILEWGVAAIQETLRERTTTMAARAAGLGLESASPDRRAGHFLGLRFSGGVPGGLQARLHAVRVYVSVRGSSLRITPHLYTSDADVDRLFGILETL